MNTTQEQDHEAIASRAYAIFLDRQREGVAGDDLSDWYAAVREVEGGGRGSLRGRSGADVRPSKRGHAGRQGSQA